MPHLLTRWTIRTPEGIEHHELRCNWCSHIEPAPASPTQETT